jgi:hypothetical protein
MIRVLLIFGILCSLFLIANSESEAQIPSGACCLPSDECVNITSAECSLSGGSYQGDGILCIGPCSPTPTPTPPASTGACCFPEGFGRICSVEGEEECNSIDGAIFQGLGTECAEIECPTQEEPSGPITIIPTMGQWGMILATIILGLFAVLKLRRRTES